MINLKRYIIFLLVLCSAIVNAQYFNGVAITGVDSGNGTNNILYSATSSTIPSLAKIRAQVISGSGYFQWNRDNLTSILHSKQNHLVLILLQFFLLLDRERKLPIKILISLFPISQGNIR